ncbi:MAG: hypothetical protein AMXMBFR4_17370 [Candidatus Hydrogenedentota bacterium]
MTRAVSFAVLLLVSVISAVAAVDGTITFSATVNNEVRQAAVALTHSEGVPYVSLVEIARQFGGRCAIEGGAIRLTLLGASASIVPDDTQVAATYGKFALQYPVRTDSGDIHIAVGDVTRMFASGFRLDVKAGQTPSTPAPSETASEQPPTETPASPPTRPAGRAARVIIDAGHGGADIGARGVVVDDEGNNRALEEKRVTLALADAVAKLLAPVCTPILVRSADTAIPVNERVSAANVTHRGDLLVSIHTGASPVAASGIDIFCPQDSPSPATTAIPGPDPSRSVALARSIAAALSQSVGTSPRAVRRAPCRIFEGLQMPAVVIEVGFITNPTEAALLYNLEYRNQLAEGIAKGIANYLAGAPSGP